MKNKERTILMVKSDFLSDIKGKYENDCISE